MSCSFCGQRPAFFSKCGLSPAEFHVIYKVKPKCNFEALIVLREVTKCVRNLQMNGDTKCHLFSVF